MADLQEKLQLGIEADNRGDKPEAIRIYRELLTEKEDWSEVHYNLGLVFKYLGEWEPSFTHNLRATELQPDDEAAWWNLGIAATALEKWRDARRAWNFFGLNYEDSDDPPAEGIGRSPVRISSGDGHEVVWGDRIDPARIIIQNIPLPESGRRFGEIVLNDGAPNGTRIHNGREYSVFDELELIKASAHQTFELECDTNDRSKFEKLAEACFDAGFGIEDWSTLNLICHACSTGTAHEEHDSRPSSEIRIALAADDPAKLHQILDDWSRDQNVEIVELIEYESED